MDLSDLFEIRETLKKVSPDIILIAGAHTNVDRCEQEPILCQQVNAAGPGEVARYAQAKKCFVVYYSTDHVFDGAGSPYIESDRVHPLNVYSQSKAEGETIIREAVPDHHLIIRTAWLYGPDLKERNFPVRLIKRLGGGESVQVPLDQWGSPTFTVDLASTTRFLIDRGETGTYHVTGPDFIDRYAYARRIASCFGLSENLLVPVATPRLAQAARRALRVQLNCSKLHSLKAPVLRDIEKGLLALKEWRMAEACLRGDKR